MIDFERGAKTSGSKFYFTSGEDAWNEWILINEMIEWHDLHGYEFIIPPYLVNKQVGEWAGILPRFDGDYYETTDGQLLIPTAETPLVGLHANEIFQEKELPIKYVAFSPCFRKEAGTYGKKDKGLKRVHQFHKVELFAICTPEKSEELHQEMLKNVVDMLTVWGLEHRVVELEEHDRSPVSNKTYDIEAKYEDEWLEISSISNMGDNQSKPAQIRYKPKGGGKNIKVHLLNGSGVALPRLLLAMNYQGLL
jgi:seryl-tRNA synthetase